MSALEVMPFANARLAWVVLKRQLPKMTVAQWSNVVATLELFFSHDETVRLQSAASDLLAALEKTIERITKLGRGMHSYSCSTNPREAPRDPRAIGDDEPVMLPPGKCDCGANEWAALVDAALTKARST